jgi:BirA family biotin operon repressor/biotin-[acetyl-CoA-carboxylase] ligase
VKFEIRHYHSVTSTNDLALEEARKGAAEGLVIQADYQSRGRGRGKKRWLSPRGKNLLFSIIIRPEIPAHKAPLLTRLAALAVKEGLSEILPPEIPVKIKKPNDVMVNGKKICGILVEGSSLKGRMEYAVVGIGLNVDGPVSRKIKRSTSIIEELGYNHEKSDILGQMLDKFTKHYEIFVGIPVLSG